MEIKTKTEFEHMTISNLKKYIFNLEIKIRERQKANEPEQVEFLTTNLNECNEVLDIKLKQEERRQKHASRH